MPQFLIETYGCQMNVADSAEVELELKKHGWEKTTDPNHADMVILNTCSVRKTAEERIEGRIGFYKNLKKKKKIRILIMGCFAQKEGERLKAKYPFINFIVGTRSKNKITDFISENQKLPFKRKSAIYTSMENDFDFTDPAQDPKFSQRAFLSIIKGCNNFCSYCIVPYTRGREISIESPFILNEIQKLAQKGVVEIFLLGQNVNSYGKDIQDISFAQLIESISKIQEIKRIKFMTSHPKDFSDELIEVISSNPKVSKHVHLPLQSASDKVLKLMNRVYTYADYLKIIEKLRLKTPQISLSTDILLGFPGENEEDYLKTYQAVEEIQYDKAFVFMYSPREGTSAYSMPETLNYREKQARVQSVLDIQHQITLKKAAGFIGQTVHVLVESSSKKNPKEMNGNNEYEYRVFYEGSSHDIGKIIPVRVSDVKGYALSGEKIV